MVSGRNGADNVTCKPMAQRALVFRTAVDEVENRARQPALCGLPQGLDGLLRFADLATDSELLAWAKDAAPIMLEKYPALAQKHMMRWLGGKLDFLKA